MASTPLVDVPHSAKTVSVSIIDTTSRVYGMPTPFLFGPTLPGFETYSACSYAFLITHHDDTTGNERRLVFDLGPPKDMQNDFPPPLVARNEVRFQHGLEVEISEYVSDILTKGGTPLESIEAVIWSHAHSDHIGRPSLFPSSVKLLVGPGFKAAFGNGYPSKPKAAFLERDVTGREVEEIKFSTDSQIGGFPAYDYFGDGSFYFLDAPGHCIGHINALARVTTNPDSFIFMAADSYLHASMLRPSKYLPLPASLNFDPPPLKAIPQECNTQMFHRLHPCCRAAQETIPHWALPLTKQPANQSPFFTVSLEEDGTSIAPDPPAARDVIDRLQKFDADGRMFLIASHDMSLLDMLEYYPKPANDWKKKGWKEQSRWTFLRDFDKPLSI